MRRSNVYLLVSGDSSWLIDSGMAGDVDQIVAELQRGGFELSSLRFVLLTHAHADHMGSAAELVRRSGARVLAHRQEVPYVEQGDALPASSSLTRFLLQLAQRVLTAHPSPKVDRALKDGDVVEVMGGLRVVHTPGHTPGSICLYQPEQRLLFCGDLLFNKHPVTGRIGLQLPMPLVSGDMAKVRESVHRVAQLPVDVLCPGHGEPIVGNAQAQIKALLPAL